MLQNHENFHVFLLFTTKAFFIKSCTYTRGKQSAGKFLSLLTLLPGRRPNRLMEPSLPFVSEENCTPQSSSDVRWLDPWRLTMITSKKKNWNPSAVRPIAAFVISVAFFGVGVHLGNPAFTSSRWYKVGPYQRNSPSYPFISRCIWGFDSINLQRS